jgi:hypothetical protein
MLFAKLIRGNRRLKWRNGKTHSLMLLNSLDSDLLITMGEAAATFQTHKYPSQFQLTYQSFRKKSLTKCLQSCQNWVDFDCSSSVLE